MNRNTTLKEVISDNPLFVGFTRTVFCNPDCVYHTRSRCRAADIRVVSYEALRPDQYAITPDVKAELTMQMGYDNEDFFNNTISCICDYLFR